MAFTRLNIAALPPMPSASDSTAIAVKPGLCAEHAAREARVLRRAFRGA